MVDVHAADHDFTGCTLEVYVKTESGFSGFRFLNGGTGGLLLPRLCSEFVPPLIPAAQILTCVSWVMIVLGVMIAADNL
ncbi:MAG: hypothetical protein E7337_01975 [Clostridiales bacterium]|nr:hypothetical protein [Clostridiales bacterium]